MTSIPVYDTVLYVGFEPTISLCQYGRPLDTATVQISYIVSPLTQFS